METILKFDNVNKSYSNGVRALHNVSFSVSPGEFVSIIGPSGAGKSTLLRAVNKLITISGGSIELDGSDITSQKGRALRDTRCKVGMIFQNYNLVYRLSVLQNTLHGCLGRMHGVKGILGLYAERDKEQAIDILRELGIVNFCYTRAGDLSGGQKQRVGIARAIMQNPKLLLCDEPIASLDPSSAKIIMDILKNMTQKRKIACIVNLHQVEAAVNYSTRIIGLSKGEIVFDGTPEELTEDVIEQIYNTPKECLMIGGKKSEEAYSVNFAD